MSTQTYALYLMYHLPISKVCSCLNLYSEKGKARTRKFSNEVGKMCSRKILIFFLRSNLSIRKVGSQVLFRCTVSGKKSSSISTLEGLEDILVATAPFSGGYHHRYFLQDSVLVNLEGWCAKEVYSLLHVASYWGGKGLS